MRDLSPEDQTPDIVLAAADTVHDAEHWQPMFTVDVSPRGAYTYQCDYACDHCGTYRVQTVLIEGTSRWLCPHCAIKIEHGIYWAFRRAGMHEGHPS